MSTGPERSDQKFLEQFYTTLAEGKAIHAFIDHNTQLIFHDSDSGERKVLEKKKDISIQLERKHPIKKVIFYSIDTSTTPEGAMIQTQGMFFMTDKTTRRFTESFFVRDIDARTPQIVQMIRFFHALPSRRGARAEPRAAEKRFVPAPPPKPSRPSRARALPLFFDGKIISQGAHAMSKAIKAEIIKISNCKQFRFTKFPEFRLFFETPEQLAAAYEALGISDSGMRIKKILDHNVSFRKM
eukprot:gnl/Chilomastix_cuspidata/1259.p1 GENE.gnl/Chilomastix_cuspidata/1259~~gnl/Chilomastix_cuspidata/1259.p1  ORF type:complete len:241 (-),score=91.59 gnl/Chilomastix_cuspidata/1259:628-1350(-)